MEEGPNDFAKETKVTFIRDEPAQQDFFLTHTRLARAVAHAIRSNPKLKVIGLLGKWGSGKSTVVHHLKAALSADSSSNYRVFTYDTWLHQSDPVRRSFLESLHRYVIEQKIGSAKIWEPRLAELSGHVEKSEIEQTPVLTKDARWILVSIIPLPVAIGLIDLDTVKDAWGSEWTWAGLVSFWISMLIFALPIFTTFVRYQINKRNAGAEVADSFLPLLLNRSIEKIRSTTFRSPEPTSIEFGNVFREVMLEIAKGGVRLIIVIDNLDRLAERDALQVWATIRSFFLSAHATEDVGHEPYHPIVVLPVDVGALERMFALESDPVSAKDLASSFISKTFDITFDVSEPVMSDWREFLHRQLSTAFHDALSAEDMYWGRRFFDDRAQGQKSRMTPREINKYVNRVAALYVQWRNEGIPFGILAHYAVEANAIDGDILGFVTNSERDLGRISGNWKNEIAAIYYGVPTDKAAQVLLEDPLRSAISDFDDHRFGVLIALPGATEILSRLVESLGGAGSEAPSLRFITNLAVLLDQVEDNSILMAEVWRNLTGLYFGSEFDASLPDLKSRLSILLKRTPVDEGGRLVVAVAEDLSGALSGNEPVKQLGALRDTAEELLSYAKKNGFGLPTFDIQTEPARFLKRLVVLSATPAVWPRLRASNPWAELLTPLLQFLSNEDHGLVPATVGLFTRPEAAELVTGFGEVEWATLINSAADLLRDPSDNPKAVGSAAEVLGLLCDTGEAWGPIEQLIDEGVISARMNECYQQGDTSAMSSMSAQLIWRETDFSAPSGASWKDIISQKPSFPQAVHSKIRRFFGRNTIRDIWCSYYEARSSRTLLESIIRYQIENDVIGSIDTPKVLQNLSWHKHPVPYRLEAKFFEILQRSSTFWEGLSDVPANKNLHAAADLASKGSASDKERVASLIKEGLSDTSTEQWSKALGSGEEPYPLAIKFLATGRLPLGIGSELHKALLGRSGTILSTPDATGRRRWFELSRLLKPKSEKELLASLGAQILGGRSISNVVGLMRAGKSPLIKHGGFASDSDGFVRSIILPLSKNKAGRAWLKEVHEELHGFVKRSSSATRQSLSHALAKLEVGRSQEARYWAEAIRTNWNLRRSP